MVDVSSLLFLKCPVFHWKFYNYKQKKILTAQILPKKFFSTVKGYLQKMWIWQIGLAKFPILYICQIYIFFLCF